MTLRVCLFLGLLIPPAGAMSAGESTVAASRPYHDRAYAGGPQRIPGVVACAYYDLGGEGVAYHDTEAKNLGSGTLNPADGTYLNEFRKDEGVDTSYTKHHDAIDDNPYETVRPPPGLLYVGWTAPGEWFNLTVEVAATGLYGVDLLYTSNQGGSIALDVDGKPAGGPLAVVSTYNAADPVAWRQWHHWNRMSNLTTLHLEKGRHVLTFRILTEGNMNFATLGFHPVR